MSDAYSHKAVWRIAAPMILSAITVPLLGMVDTAVMGHLDEPWYLGAVAAGATIFSILFMGLNFLRMGTTGITAQGFGAGDNTAVREALGQAAVTALVLVIALLVVQKPIIQAALALLAPSAEVAQFTQVYFDIRIWSAPASLLNFVMIGWLLGMQNARGPLAMMLSINLINIVLDLLFVINLGMGVKGVALATLIAELIGVVVGMTFVKAELAQRPGDWAGIQLLNIARYRHLLHINSSLLLRTMALMFVFAFITVRGARMGDIILATNALLMNFQLMLSYALDGIAHAAEALSGKAVGSRDRKGLQLAVRRTLNWSLLLAGFFCLIYLVAGGLIIDMLTSIDDIQIAARTYLPWLIISPLISVWSFLYDGVYVGATRSKEMMVVMVSAVVLLFLPTWYAAQSLGNHALWLAFTVFMAGRGAGMHYWWRHLTAQDRVIMNEDGDGPVTQTGQANDRN
jgi:MATE family multidrug resistance protein